MRSILGDSFWSLVADGRGKWLGLGCPLCSNIVALLAYGGSVSQYGSKVSLTGSVWVFRPESHLSD